MNKLVILALASAIGSSYAVAADNDSTAYQAAKDKAATEYKVAKAKCGSLKRNAKDVCVEEAKVARARADADAVAQHHPDAKDMRKAREEVADAQYGLAKEKCDDMHGNQKSACKLDAKAARDSAIADARRADPTPTMAERTAAAGDTMKDKAITTGDSTRSAANTAGDVMSDTVITTKVKADLAADPAVKAMDVHVETIKGVVMLSGFVPSKTEAEKAVQLARGVKGVSDVKSSIQIKP
jgi:osmotically-inducible protein OsmY